MVATTTTATMKSTKPTKSTKLSGTITVHNPQLIQDISAKANKCSSSKDDLDVPRGGNTSKEGTGIRRSNSSCFVNGWLSEKSVKSIQEKIDYESSEIRDLYNQLMESEMDLQRDLNETIENDAEMKRRKVRLLSTKWHEQTYQPLTKKIEEEMNGKNYRNLDKEKRQQYTNYLNHQNNKEGHVFLDVFAAEEYDPLYLNAHRPGPLKASTKKLADPLLHLQDKHIEEERIVVACDLGETLSDKEIEARRLPKLPLIPLGRHGTVCSTWLDMELTDIQSDVRLRSQEGRQGTRNISSFNFDEEYGSEVAASEVGGSQLWQKKKQFPEKYDTNVQLL